MSRNNIPRGADRHHLLHEEAAWSIRKAVELRRMGALIFTIWRDGHEELHANCPPVPVLTYPLLVRTQKSFYQAREPLANIDNLAWAMERAAEGAGVHEVEHDLALLAARAVRLQIPYITEALVVPSTQTIIDLKAA